MLRMWFLQLYLSIQEIFDAGDSNDEKTDSIRTGGLGGAYGTDNLWNERPSYKRAHNNC